MVLTLLCMYTHLRHNAGAGGEREAEAEAEGKFVSLDDEPSDFSDVGWPELAELDSLLRCKVRSHLLGPGVYWPAAANNRKGRHTTRPRGVAWRGCPIRLVHDVFGRAWCIFYALCMSLLHGTYGARN